MTAAACVLGPRALSISEGGERRDVPLFAGAMHYHRVPRRSWGACLASLRALGFTVVDTSCPWSVHERAPGRFDFHGERDLGAFLDACAAEGLLAMVRVGPRTGGELLYQGLPARIATDPEIVARTAAGNPAAALDLPRGFAAPSYASRRFLDEVRTFYAALAEVLGPRLHPKGPVAVLHLDHEQGGFYRAGAYCGDYHPDALALWHAEEGGLEPPKRFSPVADPADLVPHLRWLAFRERQATAALAALSALLDEVGLSSVPRLHGFPPIDPVVYDVAAAERAVDAAAIHFLDGKSDYARTRRRAAYLAGSSRLPLAAPLSVGTFPWGPPLGDEDAIASLLGALMHGAAGWSAHMAVGRDGWIGAPIDDSGQIRPALGEPIARIHAALEKAGWTGLHCNAAIGLLLPRPYTRLALASSHLGPLAPLGEWLRLDDAAARDDRFGLTGPVQIEQRRWRDAILSGLAPFPYVILDESASDERLAALRLLIVPTFDFFDPVLAARLHRFAEAGGAVLWGPRQPDRDAAMHKSAIALPGERLDAALLDDPTALASRLAAAVSKLGLALDPGDGTDADPAVDRALYRRRDGTPALLFLANPSDKPATATESALGAFALRDVLTGAAIVAPIALAPRTVRLFSVEERAKETP